MSVEYYVDVEAELRASVFFERLPAEIVVVAQMRPYLLDGPPRQRSCMLATTYEMRPYPLEGRPARNVTYRESGEVIEEGDEKESRMWVFFRGPPTSDLSTPMGDEFTLAWFEVFGDRPRHRMLCAMAEAFGVTIRDQHFESRFLPDGTRQAGV